MSLPGNHHQPVKIINEVLGAAFFVRELRVLGPPDAALKAVLMQALKNLLDGWSKVEGMKPERLARYQWDVCL